MCAFYTLYKYILKYIYIYISLPPPPTAVFMVVLSLQDCTLSHRPPGQSKRP